MGILSGAIGETQSVVHYRSLHAAAVMGGQVLGIWRNYCCIPVQRNETQKGATLTQMSRNAMKHRFVSQVPLVSPQQCHGWPVSGDLPLSALCTVYVRVMQ